MGKKLELNELRAYADADAARAMGYQKEFDTSAGGMRCVRFKKVVGKGNKFGPDFVEIDFNGDGNHGAAPYSGGGSSTVPFGFNSLSSMSSAVKRAEKLAASGQAHKYAWEQALKGNPMYKRVEDSTSRRARLHKALDKVLAKDGVRIAGKYVACPQCIRWDDKSSCPMCGGSGKQEILTENRPSKKAPAKDGLVGSTLKWAALLGLLYAWANPAETVGPQDYDLTTYRPKRRTF